MSDTPDGDKIAYVYHPEKNTLPGSDEPLAYFAGVPLRNLTVAEVAALPEFMQRSLAAAAFYHATANTPPPAADPDAPTEPHRARRRAADNAP